jgi:hypothetical protein
VHHLAPWLGRNLRGIPHGLGVQAKRPVPTVVPRSSTRHEDAEEAQAKSA